jgi:hypothetical protein
VQDHAFEPPRRALAERQAELIPGDAATTLAGIPAVQGVAVLFVLIQVAVSLAVDITYGSLDPKVRVS